ncbi:hypothetical protein HPP92_012894 [Vanilla planifolia]|uniref:Uncharacterized protein n=1 Tax=Vanilla planifolia TaxID=51239 RepID=A0A835QQP1_VANPL|nr:hypothetical protein HPP92_012894 [Vanilla planifolia]
MADDLMGEAASSLTRSTPTMRDSSRNSPASRQMYESSTGKNKLDAQMELFIRLMQDKSIKALSIFDSGIGINKVANGSGWFL